MHRKLGAALAVMAAAALAPIAGVQAKSAGDAFADAVPLSSPTWTDGDTVGNTVEPDEPQPCGMIGATTWYRFDNPPVGVPIGLRVSASFDNVLAVYTGSSLAELAVVACDDDSGYDGDAALQFVPDQAATYWVQLGGFGGKSGRFYLTVNQPPANDTRARATDASDGLETTVSAENATWGEDDVYGCNVHAYMTLWYRVDVPVASDVFIALEELRSSWIVDVFEQAADGSLRELACQYAEYGDNGYLPLHLRVPARPGARLFVRLATYSTIEAQLRIAPLHLAKYQHQYDSPENAKAVASLPFHDQTETVFASSVGEPRSCSIPGATVWYRFTPVVPTPVAAHTVGSDFDTFIGVFRVDPTGLTEVACNDDAAPWALTGYESAVRFVADAGATYLFQVGGFEGRSGQLALDIAGVAPGVPS